MARTRRQRKHQPAASASAAHSTSGELPQVESATRHSVLQRWPDALPAAVLVLMVVASFWPAFFAGFVWDDNRYIAGEEQLLSLAGLANIWFRPGSLTETHYWPVLYTSFWVEHKLWGFNPAGYHVVNIVLHGINTVLLWRLLLRMAVPGAWLIAAFFAVHPVHVEVVAWVIARKDLLATLFSLLAVGCWLRFRERGKTGTYLMLMLLFAASALSKTVAVTLPAILLVQVWWQHGRITGRDLVQLAPLFLLGFIIAAVDLSYYDTRLVIRSEHSFAGHLIIAAKALWFYVGKLLWPQPLMLHYPHWDVNPARLVNWLAPVAAVALVTALWLARHRIGRGPLAGVLFFGISLAPVLGFTDFGYLEYSFVADRYQYFASAGLIAVLVAAGVSGIMHDPSRGVEILGARIFAGLLLLACSIVSFQRAQVFQDEIVLFRNTIAANPGANEAWHTLGVMLMQRNRLPEAEEAFNKALVQDPDEAKIYANLGSVLLGQGRYQDAEALLRSAIPRLPDDFETLPDPPTAKHHAVAVYLNLANALMEQERPTEAEEAIHSALAIEPNHLQAQQNLAGTLDQQAVVHFNAMRFDEALALFQRSATLEPNNAETHSNLGSTLAQMGRYAEAITSFERALELNPEFTTARTNLQLARQRLNQDAELPR
ncbi:MAG: tetratricopeptide repeat protein [Pseudohongiellaceae bacterium]